MRTDADWEWEQLLLQMYEAKHMGIDLTVVQDNEEHYQAAFRDWNIISRVWSMKAILAREARRNAN